jgi:hypothetical protein
VRVRGRVSTRLELPPRLRDARAATLDIRETIETERGAISADVRGYAIPHPGAPHLHTIEGFALFRTAVPEYSAYNTAVVAIEGTVDMAQRAITIEGRTLDSDRAQQRPEELATAA